MANKRNIIDALRDKHKADIFVEQCKTGSSWMPSVNHSGKMFIMDAYTFPRSWSRMHTTGYEIKTSRSDFLADDKWPNYLDYCHYFYFVTPWGLVDPIEIPDPAGLMYLTKTGTRLYKKKECGLRLQSAGRQIPVEIFLYILICRSIITPTGMGNIAFDNRFNISSLLTDLAIQTTRASRYYSEYMGKTYSEEAMRWAAQRYFKTAADIDNPQNKAEKLLAKIAKGEFK